MATIQIRTKDTLKKQAQKVLSEMQLDLTSAINMYLYQIVATESIPFPIRTVNGFTPEQEAQMVRETEEALRSGKSYDSIEELLRDALGDEDYEDWKKRSDEMEDSPDEAI